ncbi:peptidoglycan DD-metalloendopeptidase family protein [Pseudofulvimonas gallinarii]|uniref:Lipoprotein NlpD n=2 Tax=Pseudofulvimonas gallinarii TaxID=634155 RepID=A0A4S3KU14_9GAMM|nr:peptidoglycan DD-metalloendopeptidase family protein [Pseudofulvimonas gallinarii]TCT00688.1 lipoprotein NlpD [Pseudofulvimonas gallinarii]THD11774.1 hypothetical protein B1808_14125 [Pseudofulvimonas gallinarii]
MARRLAGMIAVTLLLSGCIVTRTEVVRVRHAGDSASPAGGQGTSTASAAGTHVVSRGDTLYSIAFRAGVDWRDVAAINGLAPPYTIYPGQRLRLSRGGETAQVAHAEPLQPGAVETRPLGESAAPASARPPASTAGIQPAPPAASAPVNAPASAPPPAPATTAPVTTAPVAATPPASNPPPATAPSAPVTAPPATPAPASTPAPAPAGNAATNNAGGVRWRWPTQGELIQRFTGNDLTRPGIAIAGQSGQAVVAAADGEVVYSGSGLRGYGELIIIKHSPEFLSAYGHNRKRLVNEGQQVRAGQPIAELGRTGTDRDKLHFEIRRGGRPVDPLQFLPRQ